MKHALADAMKEAEASDGGANFGGVGPNDDGEGGFSASVGIHTGAAYAPRFTYSVDRKGHLTVVVGGDPVDVPREALNVVVRACAR